MQIINHQSKILNEVWLPDMDLNHDKQIQSLLCYRYTIGQAGALNKLEGFTGQSSRHTGISTGKHPTSNIQHPTSNGSPRARQGAIGCSMLDVRCWMFSFPQHLSHA